MKQKRFRLTLISNIVFLMAAVSCVGESNSSVSALPTVTGLGKYSFAFDGSRILRKRADGMLEATTLDGNETHLWGPVTQCLDAKLSERWLIIGVEGAAIVFGNNFQSELRRLVAEDGHPGDWFGDSVDIYGDLAVIGAGGHNSEHGVNSGAAYVFDIRTGQQLAKLEAADPVGNQCFGSTLPSEHTRSRSLDFGYGIRSAVGISEKYVLVSTGSDSVYVFEVGSWKQLHKLTPKPNSYHWNDAWGAGRENIEDINWPMGYTVDVVGDRAVLGGALGVYAFDLLTGEEIWHQHSPQESPYRFGYSIDIDGDRIAVGSPGYLSNHVSQHPGGSIYLLDYSFGEFIMEPITSSFGTVIGLDVGLESTALAYLSGISSIGILELPNLVYGYFLEGRTIGENQPQESVVGEIRRAGEQWSFENEFSLVEGSDAFSVEYLEGGLHLLTRQSFDFESEESVEIVLQETSPSGRQCRFDLGSIAIIDDKSEDSDGDGLSQSEEESHGSSDLFWDTDGDGLGDSDEIRLQDNQAPRRLLLSDLPVGHPIDINSQFGVLKSSSSFYIINSDDNAIRGPLLLPAGYAVQSLAIRGSIGLVAATNAAGSDLAYEVDLVSGNEVQRYGDAYQSDQSVGLGDTFAVIGGHNGQQGTAFVFNRHTGDLAWTLIGSSTDSSFGSAIDVGGNIIVVGAPAQDSVYAFDANTGRQIWRRRPNPGDRDSRFGASVSVSGNHLLVGAPGSITNGSAYVYRLDDGQQLHRLNLERDHADPSFGHSVSLDGVYGVVSTWDPSLLVGAAYILLSPNLSV